MASLLAGRFCHFHESERLPEPLLVLLPKPEPKPPLVLEERAGLLSSPLRRSDGGGGVSPVRDGGGGVKLPDWRADGIPPESKPPERRESVGGMELEGDWLAHSGADGSPRVGSAPLRGANVPLGRLLNRPLPPEAPCWTPGRCPVW